MMKMKKLFSAAILLLFSAEVSAQTFFGKVVDTTSAPVGYATVAVISESDSTTLRGCIAKEDGTFSLEAAQNIEYLLQISFLGYRTVTLRSFPADLGTIVLEPKDTVLDEVVVEGRIPVYRTISGGISANVSGTLLGRAGTAEDAIGRLPGVRKKPDGTFEVIGKGEPLVYIDNRKVRDRAELERLSAQDIRRIDLLTNPGAEYDASAGAVIRILTAGAARDGFSFDAGSTVAFAYRTNTSQQMNWSLRHKQAELFGTFRYGLAHSRQTSEADITTFAGNTVSSQRVSSVDISSRQNLTASAGMNYQTESGHSFGAMYEIAYVPQSAMTNRTGTEVRVDGEPYDVWTTVGNAAEKFRPTHRVDTYWAGTFGSLSIGIDADILTGRSSGTETVGEYSAKYEDALLETQDLTANRLYAGKIVLSRQLGSGRLSCGSEYTRTEREARSTGYAPITDGTDDRIVDDNLALFIGYDGSLGKTKINAGLRYEHVTYDFYENGIFCPDESKRYDNLFPTLALNTSLRSVNLTLDYRIRTERPAYGMLQSAVHYGNRLTLLSGTPDLQPTYIQSVELGCRHRNLQVSVRFDNYRNDILFMVEPLEGAPEISINRFGNADRRNELIFSVFFAPALGRWRPELLAAGNTQWFDVPYANGRKSLDGTVFHLKWGNAFTLPADFLLRIDGCWDSSGYRRNQRLISSGYVDASLNKNFANGKWNIMLEVNDLFHSVRSAFRQYDLQNTKYRATKGCTRQVKFTLRCKFNDNNSRYKGTGAGTDEMRRL